MTPKNIKLRMGRHTIEVRREGHKSKEGKKVIDIEDDLRKSVVFTLEKVQ
jgi:hypothetical protein